MFFFRFIIIAILHQINITLTSAYFEVKKQIFYSFNYITNIIRATKK